MPEAAGKAILVVDDDKDIRTAMKAALGGLGADILLAADGDEALTLAESRSPHVVVLDMMLPKRSGFLVLEKLKRGKNRSEPPRVIMITGNKGARHKTLAESMGVEVYLQKPFRMEKLVESVKNLLA